MSASLSWEGVEEAGWGMREAPISLESTLVLIWLWWQGAPGAPPDL